jgi:glycine/D-amino acid oxidase-like deaminating enzyme
MNPGVRKRPSAPGKSVLVIGDGVSGLTSALCLARNGFQVTVVADKFAPHITSIVAGALWEWPPAVCGHHHNQVSLERSKSWSEESFVPRGDDMLVLGGFAEPDEWALNIGLHNYEPIREMYRRCLELMPALRNAKVDAAEPVRVGLRPYRSRGVRLERDTGTCIIHNYGHGGSGVTLSWGCALEVVDRIEQAHVTRLVEETASAG